jgi:2-polyprenyl-3-methyl-5-hydroxy-6-metoxy-1,4-benzoquinol methylase
MSETVATTPESITATEEGYFNYHLPRFNFLLDLIAEFGASAESDILDIGASRLTEMIRERFGAKVDTLGFGTDQPVGDAMHYAFDLNHAQSRETWREDLPQYDVVVMAEVIEHLYTAPQLVLAFLKTLVKPNGILIVQTPNAASLPKRIKMLLGRNPYEMIRENTMNPGHFREYTMKELKALGERAGFRVERDVCAWYFDACYQDHHDGGFRKSGAKGTLKNAVYRSLPKGFREGITLVLRRPA